MNHLILDIKVKQKVNYKIIEKLFDEIVKIIHLNVLKREKYTFSNGGFTIFYLLAESHISAHYRIEDNYLALDIYSCNSLLKYNDKIMKIIEILEIKDMKSNYLNRNI